MPSQLSRYPQSIINECATEFARGAFTDWRDFAVFLFQANQRLRSHLQYRHTFDNASSRDRPDYQELIKNQRQSRKEKRQAKRAKYCKNHKSRTNPVWTICDVCHRAYDVTRSPWMPYQTTAEEKNPNKGNSQCPHCQSWNAMTKPFK